MVNCPICRLIYFKNRRPKQLSCDHTICNFCLQRLHKKCCPVCRKDILYTNNNLALEEYIAETKIKRTKYINSNDSEDEVKEDLFDEDFYLKSVEHDGCNLKDVSKQANKICLAAVSQNGMALEFVK